MQTGGLCHYANILVSVLLATLIQLSLGTWDDINLICLLSSSPANKSDILLHRNKLDRNGNFCQAPSDTSQERRKKVRRHISIDETPITHTYQQNSLETSSQSSHSPSEVNKQMQHHLSYCLCLCQSLTHCNTHEIYVPKSEINVVNYEDGLKMSNFSNVSDSLKSVSQMCCISSKDSELSDILSSRSSSTNQQSMICKAFSQSRRVPVEAEASTPATTAALRDNLPWSLEREKVIFCFVSTETSDIHISVILTSQATPKC